MTLGKINFSPGTNRIKTEVNLIRSVLYLTTSWAFSCEVILIYTSIKPTLLNAMPAHLLWTHEEGSVIFILANLALEGLIPQGLLHPNPSFISMFIILNLRAFCWDNILHEAIRNQQKYIDMQLMRTNIGGQREKKVEFRWEVEDRGTIGPQGINVSCKADVWL